MGDGGMVVQIGRGFADGVRSYDDLFVVLVNRACKALLQVYWLEEERLAGAISLRAYHKIKWAQSTLSCAGKGAGVGLLLLPVLVYRFILVSAFDDFFQRRRSLYAVALCEIDID